MTEQPERLTYEFLLEARTPIAHHSETMGNISVLMTRKHRMGDGQWCNLPIITGDTMRHGMREAGMLAYLEAAGVDGHLTPAALRLLFAGGMVTGSSGGSVSLTEYRDMVELCPPLHLLGGCVSNRIVPGRMSVDEAVLVCTETARNMPQWVDEYIGNTRTVLSAMRSHVEEAQRTRMDPTLDPMKREMLKESAQEHVQQRMLISELAADTGDAAMAQREKSSMMPRSYERIASGSLFHWRASALCRTELERDTFHVMLTRFLADARVGGKQGTGHGKLYPKAAQSIVIDVKSTQSSVEIAEIGGRVGDTFRNHVAERKDRIAAFLAEVAA